MFFSKPLLNKEHFSSSFVSNQQAFVFTSYKKALNLTNLFLGVPLEQSSLALANFDTLNSYLKFFPFYIKKTEKKNVFQKINYLYNFSFHFNKDSIFVNPETFILIQNTFSKPCSLFSTLQESISQEGKKNFHSSLINNQNFYDLDFYWKNYKPNDDLFWISSSSFSLRDLKEKKIKNNFSLILLKHLG